ncbi:hypothetical protein P7C71_g4734, partial [Lecanoromycetidae sp. Uapishka_2]
MRRYNKCVLLTRVGSFYELYFEQADKYGPLLNLKVAQKKTAAGSVSMSGFPVYQLDRFLKILVEDLNESVALSEEFPNDASGTVKSGGLMHDRRVTRTITPGTLIDEKFMDPYNNNFLLALHALDVENPQTSEDENVPLELTKGLMPPSWTSRPVGLAWLDLSTGDFFTQTTALGMLASAAARIGAREILLSNSLDKNLRQNILNMLEQQRDLVTYHSMELAQAGIASWTPMLEAEVPSKIWGTFTTEEVAAGSLLLSYTKESLQGLGIKLQPPVRRRSKETMSIDKNSMRALEVLGTSKEGLSGGKGSLLHAVRRTNTKSGARLLRDWIASPSMSLQVINARLDLVSHLLHDRAFKEDIETLLRRTFDSQRLVQKFSMGRGDADDLVSLLRTIEATNAIASALDKRVCPPGPYPILSVDDQEKRQSLQALQGRLSLDGPNALAALIAASIDEDSLMESHRIEETGNADIVLMAQEVLHNEGSAEDQAVMSRVSRSKVKPKAIMEQDLEDEDTWTA